MQCNYKYGKRKQTKKARKIRRKMGSFFHGSGSLLLPSLALAMLMVLPAALSAGNAPLTHHGGRLLTGNLNIGILWYGPIPRVQKKAILSFLRSLNSNVGPKPQVSSWWQVVESYQSFAKPSSRGGINVKVVSEQSDPNYSLGKVLIKDFIKMLLPKATGGKPNTLAIIVAPKGVTVQDMCAGSCAQHGLIGEQPYVAVGDPSEECSECAWPFMKSPSRPAGIVAPPSGNVGADAMVKLLAGGLAGAVTNPFGDGFYATARGDQTLEATTNCPAMIGNVNGNKGSKFVLPAIWSPKTSSCYTP